MVKIETIAVWVGIAGAAAGVYFPIHDQLAAKEKEEVKQAQVYQKTMDEINNRFENLEEVVTVLSEEMPQDKKDILDQIRKVQEDMQKVEDH